MIRPRTAKTALMLAVGLLLAGHALGQEAPAQASGRDAALPELAQPTPDASPLDHFFVLELLEVWDAKPGIGQEWDAMGWLGTDLNRLWVRTEGKRIRNSTDSAHLELLYGRSLNEWWDLIAGVRHDFQPDSSRDWAVIGFQGLAPYKFEVEASAYLASSGHLATTLEVEYELLFTDRLILQPQVEFQLFSKDDPASGNGSGLAVFETALRLRYEFSRRVAPYIGVIHERAYGRTASFREADGEAVRDTRLVVGVRLW